MDKIDAKKFEGAKITSLLEVSLKGEILEIYFNLKFDIKETSVKIFICDDGETINFNEIARPVEIDDIKYSAYRAKTIEKDTELGKLIDNEIKLIRFGVGKELGTDNEVLYYFMMATDKNEFLFFNNGDRGAYCFKNLDLVLSNDIYKYRWSISTNNPST